MACGAHTPDMLIHSVADGSAKKEGKGEDAAFAAFVCGLISTYFDSYLPRTRKPALLTGNDLIERYNLIPSPAFKKILNAVEEARLSGIVQGKADAYAFVRPLIDELLDNRPVPDRV